MGRWVCAASADVDAGGTVLRSAGRFTFGDVAGFCMASQPLPQWSRKRLPSTRRLFAPFVEHHQYDGANSIEIVKTNLRNHGVPKSTRIHFFTTDKAMEVISI